jgi:hypothetical protein
VSVSVYTNTGGSRLPPKILRHYGRAGVSGSEVIAASDAMNNAQVELEEAAEGMDAERWEGIRRHVFSLLEAEHERLAGEYRCLSAD